jgi:putative mRNA 3-end processing factor
MPRMSSPADHVTNPAMQRFEDWLTPTPRGLYCAPGDFYIDPHLPVDRAIITHGHSDHARGGHGAVLATAETIAVMKLRIGANCAGSLQTVAIGETLRLGSVEVTLRPAGHILGSAQIVMTNGAQRAVVSGDYKRRPDPTCQPFEPVACDLFVTEATFGLPVFRHPPDNQEIGKLLASHACFPERTHMVGVYGLGKCQRLIALLRRAGYDRTIYLHGALEKVCALYTALGQDLGALAPVSGATESLAGEIVLCPPSALADRWSRRMVDPVTCVASGWMRVRGRARQRGVELPLVISDHCDWPELLDTITETGAGEIWVTHGREDALVHQINKLGRRGRALALVGREDEAD